MAEVGLACESFIYLWTDNTDANPIVTSGFKFAEMEMSAFVYLALSIQYSLSARARPNPTTRQVLVRAWIEGRLLEHRRDCSSIVEGFELHVPPIAAQDVCHQGMRSSGYYTTQCKVSKRITFTLVKMTDNACFVISSLHIPLHIPFLPFLRS